MQSQPRGKRRLGLLSYTRFIGLAIIISVLIVACSSQADFPTGEFDHAQLRIHFKSDGTFTVWRLNVETFEVEDGRYSVVGDQITLQDEECDPDDGIYTWEFDDEKLVLDSIEDACDGRRQNLNGKKYFLQP
jgi:hypothetical protein